MIQKKKNRGSHLLSARSASIRDQHWSAYFEHFLRVTSHLDYFLHEKDTLSPYWNRYLLYLWICLACNASPKPTIHGLIECLIHSRGISHIASDLVAPILTESTGLAIFLPSWSIWPDRMVEWLKTVTEQLGNSTLEWWYRVLQKAVYTLNWCPIYGMVSSHSQNSQVLGERERFHLLWPLMTQLGNCLLPVLQPGGLEVLVPEWGLILPKDTKKTFHITGSSDFSWPLWVFDAFKPKG